MRGAHTLNGSCYTGTPLQGSAAALRRVSYGGHNYTRLAVPESMKHLFVQRLLDRGYKVMTSQGSSRRLQSRFSQVSYACRHDL